MCNLSPRTSISHHHHSNCHHHHHHHVRPNFTFFPQPQKVKMETRHCLRPLILVRVGTKCRPVPSHPMHQTCTKTLARHYLNPQAENLCSQISMSQFHITPTRLLSLLPNCSSTSHITQIQTHLVTQNLHSVSTVFSAFISACKTLRLLNLAHLHFLTQLPNPHVFTCNSLIRAFSHSHTPHTPLSIYTHMTKASIPPNHYTFPLLFKSMSDFNNLRQGQCLHTHVIKLGQWCDIYVQNSALDLYGSCGRMDMCRKVFDEMPVRDVVSWTGLIKGFRKLERFGDALRAFEQMQWAGVAPNAVTMVNALAACASFGAVETGVWIHEWIRREGWELDVKLGTALIDMYGTCGKVDEALEVFDRMEEKNSFTWNALIKGFALAKSGQEAVWWFGRMEEEGFVADEVTLVQVLCACSHSGLVDVGRQIFSSLRNGKYGFLASVKHYACMIDLLARAGCLEDALRCLREMPYVPSKAMWGSLLAAGKTYADLELSEFAATKLVGLEPGNSGYYVLLSNLYAEMGRWDDVERVRTMMKDRDLKKDLGCSSNVDSLTKVINW